AALGDEGPVHPVHGQGAVADQPGEVGVAGVDVVQGGLDQGDAGVVRRRRRDRRADPGPGAVRADHEVERLPPPVREVDQCAVRGPRHHPRHAPPPLDVEGAEEQVAEVPAVDLGVGQVARAGAPVAQDGPVRVQDAHGLTLGAGQRPEPLQQPRLVQGELAQLFVQVQDAALGAGVGGGVAFEDGDGVAAAVHDAGEGEAGGAGADHGDAASHVVTLYFAVTVYRNSTV